MEKEVLEKYKRAEEISSKVIEFSKGLLKEDESVLEIAEGIEGEIFRLGGKPAFPVNIGINEVAAHFTPDIGESLALKAGDLVKVDIGIHVDGFICDRAFTVCIGKESHPLIEACERALEEALKSVKPGRKIFEISETVESALAAFGFNPVRNLCGHGLERFKQHAPPSIPNGRNAITEQLREGQVIAMEVFATNGSGWVKESYPALIYQFVADKVPRLPEARKVLALIKDRFEGLPFARRWLKEISSLKLDFALRQLVDIDAIKAFPILKEQTGGLVAQAEETVML